MDVPARVSSKGQITIPRAVREALTIEEGDEVIFRVEGQRGNPGAQPRPHPARRLGERAGTEAGYALG